MIDAISGSLAVSLAGGSNADFIILDGDPVEAIDNATRTRLDTTARAPYAPPSMPHVLQTYVGGRCVHGCDADGAADGVTHDEL